MYRNIINLLQKRICLLIWSIAKNSVIFFYFAFLGSDLLNIDSGFKPVSVIKKYSLRIEFMSAGTYYVVSTFTFVPLRDTKEGRTR